MLAVIAVLGRTATEITGRSWVADSLTARPYWLQFSAARLSCADGSGDQSKYRNPKRKFRSG